MNIKFASVLAALGLTPAALSAATVGGTFYAPQYNFSEFFAATDGKAFQVVLSGNAFPGIDPGAVASELLPHMQAARPRPALTFTYEVPAERLRPDYRLVLTFDPANDLSSAAVCNGQARFKRGWPGVVYVHAVYCRDQQVMAETTAWTKASSPNDPRVGQLFRELFQVLFSDSPVLNRSSGPIPVAARATGSAPSDVAAGRDRARQSSKAPEPDERCKSDTDSGKSCARPYFLIQAVYFNPKQYSSAADCLTAAYSARLPLDLCH